ncbi:MAG: hypothetical protein ACTSO7_09595 [Candidatus Heimdallarchaeota archaeon]
MEISLHYYYWDEVMGPLLVYHDGSTQLKQEDVFMLLSSIEPYSETTESSLAGPYYIGKDIFMVYNRSVNNPDAHDERIKLMGTDCWVMLSVKKEHELVLCSQIEIVQMVLDIEFDNVKELSDLGIEMTRRTVDVIRKIYLYM